MCVVCAAQHAAGCGGQCTRRGKGNPRRRGPGARGARRAPGAASRRVRSPGAGPALRAGPWQAGSAHRVRGRAWSRKRNFGVITGLAKLTFTGPVGRQRVAPLHGGDGASSVADAGRGRVARRRAVTSDPTWTPHGPRMDPVWTPYDPRLQPCSARHAAPILSRPTIAPASQGISQHSRLAGSAAGRHARASSCQRCHAFRASQRQWRDKGAPVCTHYRLFWHGLAVAHASSGWRVPCPPGIDAGCWPAFAASAASFKRVSMLRDPMGFVGLVI